MKNWVRQWLIAFAAGGISLFWMLEAENVKIVDLRFLALYFGITFALYSIVPWRDK